MRKYLVVVLAAFFSCASIALAQEKIVAIVNGDIVTQRDLDEFLNFMRMQFSAEFEGAELETKVQSVKSDLLNKLIEDRLILQEAKRKGAEVVEERVKVKIDAIKRRYASDTDFQNALVMQGLTQADMEKKIREQLLMLGFIDFEIKRKVSPAPSEITAFYEENKDKFKTPQVKEIEAAVLPGEKQSQEIYALLRKGTGWDEVVRKYGLDTNTLSISEHETLKKEIDSAVSSLRPGQFSAPVKIDDRYYLFRLNSILPPRQQRLEEVQGAISKFLTDRKQSEKLSELIAGLKERSYIKIMQNE